MPSRRSNAFLRAPSTSWLDPRPFFLSRPLHATSTPSDAPKRRPACLGIATRFAPAGTGRGLAVYPCGDLCVVPSGRGRLSLRGRTVHPFGDLVDRACGDLWLVPSGTGRLSLRGLTVCPFGDRLFVPSGTCVSSLRGLVFVPAGGAGCTCGDLCFVPPGTCVSSLEGLAVCPFGDFCFVPSPDGLCLVPFSNNATLSTTTLSFDTCLGGQVCRPTERLGRDLGVVPAGTGPDQGPP
uniref:Uncharacterized protein n=1 Tax=Mycena chlorophos TaxID=658473 RepID=A0ABQ0LUF6_MYCCL|nr:predicted protein [Mycena chlorophos]